jgi:hypothetical protein
MSIAMKPKNDPMMGDSSRLLGMQIYDQMESGEIYAPDADIGMGGTFVSPGADPMNPRDSVLTQSGYNDAMATLPGNSGAPQVERLANIQQMSGAQMDVRNPFYQEDPMIDQAKVEAYKQLSPADKMALDFVRQGKLDAADYYKIQKTDEQKREAAMLKMLENADPAQFDFMEGDAPAAASGDTMRRFVQPGGGVTATVSPRTSNSNQNITSKSDKTIIGGGGGGGSGGARPEESEKAWKDFRANLSATENTYASMTTDSKLLDKPELIEQKGRVNQMRLTNMLGNFNTALSVGEASNRAQLAVATGQSIFADTQDPMMTDSTGTTKLNINGVLVGQDGKRLPVAAYIAEGYTVDQILATLKKKQNGATGSF